MDDSSLSLSESLSKFQITEQQQSQQSTIQSEKQQNHKLRSHSHHACQKNKFLCGQCYEFTDQNAVLKQTNQPFLEKMGDYILPQPQELQEHGTVNQINGITEEGLDDWIAQSLNRPIVSFLDPYKKFQVPDMLVNTFKQRYSKYYQDNPDKTNAKKRLYFEKPNPNDSRPHYMLPKGETKREREKDITVKQSKLRPKSLPGIPITKRETNYLKNRGLNIPDFNVSIKQQNSISNQDQEPENSLYENSTYKDNNALYDSGYNQNLYQSQNSYINNSQQQQYQSHNNSNHLPQKQQNKYPKLPQINGNMSFNQYKLAKMKIDSSKKKITNHLLNPRRLSRTSSQYTQDLTPKLFQQQQNQLLLQQQKVTDKKPKNQNQIQENLQEENQDFENEEKPIQIQIYKLLNINDKTIPVSKGSLQNKSKNKNQDLNLHTEFIETEEPTIEKSKLQEVDFNYWRAVRRILQGKQTDAIKCLKDNLQNYPDHFPSIFNLANLYERAKRYQLSQRWYTIALKFNEYTDECKFGISLALYKQQKYQESLDILGTYGYPIKYETRHAAYLKIVNNKMLGNLNQSNKDFQQFIKLTCPKNYNLLMHFMFAIIFANLRGLEIKFSPLVYCDFMSLANNVTDIYYNPQLKIAQNNEQEFLKKLQKLRFFKRFSKQILQQNLQLFLQNMKYINKDEIIHPKKNKVFIITSGIVYLWDCIKGYDQPTIISFHHEGDIIGMPDLDNSICQKPDIFLQISTDQLQYIELETQQFLNLWNLQQQNKESHQIYEYLKKSYIFQNVSELTLHKLAYEFMTIQDFTLNDVIFNSGQALQEDHIKYIKVLKKKQLTKEEKQALKAKLKKQKLEQQQNPDQKEDKTADFQKQIVNGFYLIKSGFAELQTPSGQLDNIMREGDFMGEDLLFNTESITRFGIIVSKSSPCTCLFLKKHFFEEINQMDREIMKQNITSQPKYSKLQLLIKQIDQQKQQQQLNK